MLSIVRIGCGKADFARVSGFNCVASDELAKQRNAELGGGRLRGFENPRHGVAHRARKRAIVEVVQTGRRAQEVAEQTPAELQSDGVRRGQLSVAFGCMPAADAVQQHLHRRKAALQFCDRISVERSAGDHAQLTVDGPPDRTAIGVRREQTGQVLAEMIEHRRYESVLAAEVPVDQTMVDVRASRDVPDGRCSGPALCEQIGGRFEDRGNDLGPAKRCAGADRFDPCPGCSHVTTVPGRRLR